MLAIRVTASIAAIVCATAAPAAAADVQSRLRENWRAEIVKTPTPAEGCFKAEYPSKTWAKIACTKAPIRPFIPRGMHHTAGGFTVGNGNDYSAVAHGTITQAQGTFPTVTGVKTESDGGANIYSIQLNSNFFTTAVCNGSSDPGNCQGWEQFVYSSSSEASFIQYWLLDYGNTCPTTPYNDWNNYEGSCYRNSNAVGIPQEPITALSTFKLAATVTSTKDTFVTTTESTAYSTSGNDNVVKLATGWAANEFNVVGDGGGSKATFNTGSSITVQINQRDGTTTAPTCEGDDGTTGETNNLTLGSCSTAGGSYPYVKFTEKH